MRTRTVLLVERDVPRGQAVVVTHILARRLCESLEKLDGEVERKSLAGYFPEEFLLVDPPC